MAFADSLAVSPTRLTVAAPAQTTTLTIKGKGPAVLQIRVMAWKKGSDPGAARRHGGIRFSGRGDYLGRYGQIGLELTGLQSYHRNRVSVDLADLPVDLALDASGMDVVPGIGSGVRVKLRGDTEDRAVIVQLGADGTPLEAGMIALLNGGSEAFFVGFGGETLVQGLRRTNRLTVQSDTRTCTASFDFAAQTGALQKIEGVLCR